MMKYFLQKSLEISLLLQSACFASRGEDGVLNAHIIVSYLTINLRSGSILMILLLVTLQPSKTRRMDKVAGVLAGPLLVFPLPRTK